MCTVSYLPKNNGGYILTSSRDEKVIRAAAIIPQHYLVNGKDIIFPKDPVAGGSWIAYSENKTACLLNGAFEKHISSPSYRRSRGLVLLDYFSYPDAKDFAKHYDFKGIEPFTLVIIHADELSELRWDGISIHLNELDAQAPQLWSSVTLYPKEIVLKRKEWFQIWLSANYKYEVEDIRHFHRSAGDGDIQNDVLMNRNNFMQTVSITTVEKTSSSVNMIYEDLLSNILVCEKVAMV